MRRVGAGVLLALAGCGTMQDISRDRYAKALFGPSVHPHVFGGVRMDAYMSGQAHSLGWLHLLDLPFSFVVDVALLPITIPVSLFSKPSDDPEIPQ